VTGGSVTEGGAAPAGRVTTSVELLLEALPAEFCAVSE